MLVQILKDFEKIDFFQNLNQFFTCMQFWATLVIILGGFYKEKVEPSKKNRFFQSPLEFERALLFANIFKDCRMNFAKESEKLNGNFANFLKNLAPSRDFPYCFWKPFNFEQGLRWRKQQWEISLICGRFDQQKFHQMLSFSAFENELRIQWPSRLLFRIHWIQKKILDTHIIS